MEKLISKMDNSLLNVSIVMEYLKKNCKRYKILNEEIENESSEIEVLVGNEIIRIVFVCIIDGKWWSIYKYHSDGTKYEQIDVMMYDEVKPNGSNIIIKYSTHIEDNNFSYINCSCYWFINEQYIKGWSKNRTVSISELKNIQYTKSMNLTELIYMTDSRCNNIIQQENLKNVDSVSLKMIKKSF